MRLLQIQPDGTLSLVEFFGDDIPRYAILSHTWGSDSEEVSFQDVEKNGDKIKPPPYATLSHPWNLDDANIPFHETERDEGIKKSGYRKIGFCAEQSKHDGLRHFWVDTCCINRLSMKELSEAINSMF